MRQFIKGAKRELAVEVMRKDCLDDFTIEKGTYAVKNKAMETVQSGNLFIDKHRASFLVDTTTAGYLINQTYTPYWTITIDDMEKLIIEKIGQFVITA